MPLDHFKPDQANASDNESGDEEISLLDIVNFLADSWKKLLIAGVVGATLGFASWNFLGSYLAEYVLINNNTKTNTNINIAGLDLAAWKSLQKNLPNLASQMAQAGSVSEAQVDLYKTVSNEEWWKKNIATSYLLNKADVKDLAAIGKDLEGASSMITSLTLNAGGSSKEQAINNVKAVAQFIRSGGAYLQLRNLFNRYEIQTINSLANVKQKLSATQIELTYQQGRLKNLENLNKRYPTESKSTNQVVDLKDSDSKYLPLGNQIIAANNDINASKESLMRLNQRIDQLVIIKTFLDQASPILNQSADGLALYDQFLAIEASLRSKLAKGDFNGEAQLDQVRADLVEIYTRFNNGLESNSSPTVSKKGMIKSTAGGLALGLFLMFGALLARTVLVRLTQSAQAVQSTKT